jgi:L-arabinose isomerase
VALRRAGFGFGAEDDLVALAAVVRAAAVVAEGGGTGYAEAVAQGTQKRSSLQLAEKFSARSRLIHPPLVCARA